MRKSLPTEPTREMKRKAEHAYFLKIKFQCFKLGINANNSNHFLTAKTLVDAQK